MVTLPLLALLAASQEMQSHQLLSMRCFSLVVMHGDEHHLKDLSENHTLRSEILVEMLIMCSVDAFHHPSHARQGTTVVEGGYYLKDDLPDAFDAPFFSMTKGEADAMDPQQRLLLEVAYESMENAGIPMESLIGSDTSCFVGGMTKDYENVSISDVNDVLQYSAIGNGLGMLSNRLSWFYDLRGPSMTTDTACSSSMVALHLGCQAIRAAGCQKRTTIIGGVGLILAPDTMITGNALKVYSPDSRCFSYVYIGLLCHVDKLTVIYLASMIVPMAMAAEKELAFLC